MQTNTKIKILVWLIVLAVIGIVVNYVFSEIISTHWNPISKVYVRDIQIKAEVVRTQKKIELGLGGRSSIAPGRGMLFEMPGNAVQNFWMKGMRFPIDIIWIESGRVIGCEKNIAPGDQRIFSSPGDAGMVLEVPAGFCDENSININDEVKIQPGLLK